MRPITRSGLHWSLYPTCLVMFASGPVAADYELAVTAMDDRPASVRVQVTAKDGGGATLLTDDLFWSADDNNYSTQTLLVPLETRTLRFTFLGDCCGPNGPGDCGAGCTVCDAVGDPDCDRNAFIDSFTVCGQTREGESFDRADGCVSGDRGGRTVAVCGQEGDWAEYDLLEECVPTLSEWGLIVMGGLVLVAGTVFCLKRGRGTLGFA